MEEKYFENITKKEFIRLLTTSENELLYSNLSLHEVGCTKVMQALFNGTYKVLKPRKCIEVKSTYAKFTSDTSKDGSCLYFNSIHKCYKHNNVILTYNEYWDSFEQLYRYEIIAYVINEI